jgi:hypothetical protein
MGFIQVPMLDAAFPPPVFSALVKGPPDLSFRLRSRRERYDCCDQH